MSADDKKRAYRNDLVFAAMLVTLGLVISGLSLTQLTVRHQQELAQATPPLQPSPSPPDVQNKPPADPKPGGDRPTTPAPEPARPDPEAQKTGAQPVLPPAPAEKTAPPIKER
jgi:hypothetical protein